MLLVNFIAVIGTLQEDQINHYHKTIGNKTILTPHIGENRSWYEFLEDADWRRYWKNRKRCNCHPRM